MKLDRESLYDCLLSYHNDTRPQDSLLIYSPDAGIVRWGYNPDDTDIIIGTADDVCNLMPVSGDTDNDIMSYAYNMSIEYFNELFLT